MAAILTILVILLLIGWLGPRLLLWWGQRTMKNFAKRMQQEMDQQTSQTHAQSTQARHHTDSAPIFADDEGTYIDFEEVKDP